MNTVNILDNQIIIKAIELENKPTKKIIFVSGKNGYIIILISLSCIFKIPK